MADRYLVAWAGPGDTVTGRAFLFFFCWWLLPSEALAEPDRLDRAETLFANGNFHGATALAVELGTADGYELAARSIATYATYFADPAMAERGFHCARVLAENALALAPKDVEAGLQLVIALGQLGRTMEPIAVLTDGIVERADALLRDIEARAPGNPFVHALRGAWHTEIVLQGGAIAAWSMFGASREDAIAAYLRAIALSPDDPVILVEFAKSVLRLNATDRFGEAHEAASVAVALEPGNALDRIAQSEASGLLAHWPAESGSELVDFKLVDSGRQPPALPELCKNHTLQE